MSDSLFAVAVASVALLYSMVGQAGGTGYVAVMGLAGFPADAIKSTALALNILVASIGCFRFYRAGILTWRSCYPFAVLGAPFSLLGGAVNLPPAIYHPVVGLLLIGVAAQMFRSARGVAARDLAARSDPPFLPSLAMGGVIGFVSSVTGVGGGIFLAPVILMLGWATTRATAGISAMFNLMNSAAALVGVWATAPAFPAALPLWLLAAGIGGLAGSWLSLAYLKPATLRFLLAVLLAVAGVRMALPF